MKTIICILLMFTYLVGLSQERVNRENLKFERSSLVLDNVDGWSYDSKIGEWIKKRNEISVENGYDTFYESLNHTSQKFTTLQTKNFKFDGKLYYVFIIRKFGSGYRYPTIHSGYRSWLEYDGYICTENEYKKLYNIESTVNINFSDIISLGLDEEYNESLFLDYVQNALINKDELRTMMPIIISKEGKIRFYLPKSNYEHERHNFEKGYFETDIQNFNKIIIK